MKSFNLRDIEGFGPTICARVANYFPTDDWRDAPYELTKVRGVGFSRADRVAQRLGVSPSSKERIDAGAWHLLGEAENGGDTGMPVQEFTKQLLNLLQVRLIDFDFDSERFYEEGGLISRLETTDAERAVAAQVRVMMQRQPPAAAPPPVNGLYRDQAEALAAIQQQNIFVLLGGPGTGKTHLVRQIAKNAGMVKLCAPTGKAAKRIEELSGLEASTIHRLLEPTDWRKDNKAFSRGFTFGRTRRRPIDADLVIVDETSMCDVRLMADLMDALSFDTRLILVGDPFQLPSVGPGAVLRDLVASGVVPYMELTELKRQNPDLLIARNCQAIRFEKRVIVDNRAASDFFMLPFNDPVKAREQVVELVCERLPEKYGFDPKGGDIMVIAPLKEKGDLSVKALNEALRKRLNPEAAHLPGIWVGDRVIQKSNDRELDVVNGDMGTVIEADDKRLTIAFDTPEREIEGSRADFDVDLAYALTVHKSQGSQANGVVFVVDPSGSAQYLAEAQLTYTGISRASEVCVCVGSRKALDAQAARHKAINRWTRLSGLLRQN